MNKLRLCIVVFTIVLVSQYTFAQPISMQASPSSIDVQQGPQSTTLTLTFSQTSSTASWSITAISDTSHWLSVSPSSGNINALTDTITVTIADGGAPGTTRSGYLLIRGVGVTPDSITVPVTQTITGYMDPISINSLWLGGDDTIRVLSIADTTTWTVSTTDDWLSVDPTTGIGPGIFVITISREFGAVNRNGMVLLQLAFPIPVAETLFVRQTGHGIATLSVAPVDWQLDDYQSAQQSFHIDLTGSQLVPSRTITCDSSWIQFSPQTGSGASSDVLVTVAENPDTTSRITTFQVTSNVTANPQFIDITVSQPGQSFISAVHPGNNLVREFRLENAYPNPFNNTTTIRYSLPTSSVVQLDIIDMSGRTVETLSHGRVAAGRYSVMFHGDRLSSGEYIVRLRSEGRVAIRKIILVK